jgi:hypothetical protein
VFCSPSVPDQNREEIIMDDLIRREDAIKAIEELPNAYNGWSDAYDKAYIIGTLEEVPSADRPQGEWIPCSEKLPSENGDYLVTLENGVVKILGYSTTQRTTYPKGFYHIEDGFSWRQIQNPVVAWMPLPEPWKGADDE